MANDNLMTEIVAPTADCQLDWEKARKELAASYRLVPVCSSHVMVREALAHAEVRFLNMGSFSRVYVLDEHRVLKFCYDLASLQIMERLGARSRFFARVDQVLERQAMDGADVYHLAVVERLQEGHPRWVTSLVDGYRRPRRADTPRCASQRLLEMSDGIIAGDIEVPPGDVKDLAHAMRLLAVECANEGCLADLRTEQNVMVRNGREAVIADPTHPPERGKH